jgi:hypothetical protein
MVYNQVWSSLGTKDPVKSSSKRREVDFRDRFVGVAGMTLAKVFRSLSILERAEGCSGPGITAHGSVDLKLRNSNVGYEFVHLCHCQPSKLAKQNFQETS